MRRKWSWALAAGVCLGLVAAGVGIANELIWMPINPSFGGNPANGSWLLASAQAQNTMVPKTTTYTRPDPLADFEYSLKRQYLSRLADRIMDDVFGEDTLLPSEQTDAEYTLGDYHVQITTLGSIKVTITDTITGNQTDVEVPYY
jgi:curli production assembly/transport component CsgF